MGYKSRITGVLAVVILLTGCATTDVLKIPLKYGQELSRDSIRLNCNLETVSMAISKVKGKQRIFECKFYNTKQLSDNLWSIEKTESFSVCSKLSDEVCQEQERKRIFDILLIPTEDKGTIIKVDKGSIIATAKGGFLAPGTTFQLETSCGQILGWFIAKDGFNKALVGPVKEEMDEEELYYNLKDFVLLMEKFLPTTKK